MRRARARTISARYTFFMPSFPSRLSFAEIQNTAVARGGRCMSKAYKNNKQKLAWQCAQGHQWHARAMNIRAGCWCPTCAGNAPKSIDELQALAARRGGSYLSKSRVAMNSNALWRCAEGHAWRTQPKTVSEGSWCPRCAPQARLTIEDMQRAARSRGGRCLSRRYINCRQLLSWRCSKGHSWQARGEKIRRGQWCRKCWMARRAHQKK